MDSTLLNTMNELAVMPEHAVKGRRPSGSKNKMPGAASMPAIDLTLTPLPNDFLINETDSASDTQKKLMDQWTRIMTDPSLTTEEKNLRAAQLDRWFDRLEEDKMITHRTYEYKTETEHSNQRLSHGAEVFLTILGIVAPVAGAMYIAGKNKE